MFISRDPESESGEDPTFERLARTLGRTFLVRDVMVPLKQIKSVAHGDEAGAASIISELRYSVVPISEDKMSFEAVFYPEFRGTKGSAKILRANISLVDHIPDSTTLAEAFPLFREREWYLTFRANRVSGLITYWAFNSREFCVQLFAALSRVEELSKDVLEGDGKGILDESGLVFDEPLPKKTLKNFKKTLAKNGGNRFLDALGFSHISQALAHTQVWREFLDQRTNSMMSDKNYKERYGFVDLRNAVMHGRTPFPDYELFKKRSCDIYHIGELIDYLDAYRKCQEDLSGKSR
jgi:hypothetical protein